MTVIHSIFNGNSAYAGGEIYNVGMLTVNDSTITNNSAISFAGTPRVGGRFYNIGMLTVNDSTITNNLATDYGGGICNESSQLVVR